MALPLLLLLSIRRQTWSMDKADDVWHCLGFSTVTKKQWAVKIERLSETCLDLSVYDKLICGARGQAVPHSFVLLQVYECVRKFLLTTRCRPLGVHDSIITTHVCRHELVVAGVVFPGSKEETLRRFYWFPQARSWLCRHPSAVTGPKRAAHRTGSAS